MAGCPLGGAHGRDLGSTAPTHADPGAARARHNPTESSVGLVRCGGGGSAVLAGRADLLCATARFREVRVAPKSSIGCCTGSVSLCSTSGDRVGSLHHPQVIDRLINLGDACLIEVCLP